jgi:glycosyltransferase involved in cell wall biosynthesis
MRLLFVTNHFPPDHVGGYELYCAATAEALRVRGHDVFVMTGTSRPTPGVEAMGVLRFDPTLTDVEAFEDNGVRIRDAITRWSIDAALVWNTFGLGHHEVYGALRGIPATCYLMLHDLAYHGPQTLRELRLIASSQLIRFHFLRRGFAPSSLPLIYPGVELPPGSRQARHDERTRVLYCGRLVSYKGLHVALLALEDLPSGFTLTVIGAPDRDSGYGEQQRQWVRDHLLDERVTFRGPLPHEELPAEYLAHDVLVFPSIWEEPLGLVVLEAMAAGLPVSASRRGAPVELVTHGRTGLLHDPGNPRDLARTLTTLATPSANAAMGQAARECVGQRFAFRRYVDDIEAELAALTAAG